MKSADLVGVDVAFDDIAKVTIGEPEDTCILSRSGQVACNGAGVIATNAVDVAVGAGICVLLEDADGRSIECNNGKGAKIILSDPSAVPESLDQSYATCAVSTDHLVYCYDNRHWRNFTEWQRIAGLDDVGSVATSCALRVNGEVWCWGWFVREPGIWYEPSDPLPAAAPVVGLHDVTAITAGRNFVCALTSKSEVWCWGANAGREFGTSQSHSSVPVKVFQ